MSDVIETTLCTNCKHDILSSNFVIHTIHCQRNLYLCPKCDEPVNRGQQAKHDESYHVSIFCKSCHTQLEKWKLSDHLSNDCPKRKIKCKICDIEKAVSDISEHENYCGARTEKCTECGEFVMLKYKQLHIDSNHTFIKLSDEPGPSPSWQNGQRFLGNFLSDIDSGNIKTQSNQKKKAVQNRIKNSVVDDLYNTKKIQNEAAGQYSNEKNNIFQSNQIKKTMPIPPKETALGAVKKSIPPKYSSPLVTNKIFDNNDPDFKAKSNDKAINQVIKKKSINTEDDHTFELDRLIALQISEEEEKKNETIKAERKRIAEEADLLLALQINDELNSKDDTVNDHLLAQNLIEEPGDEKPLNTGFLMDSYEKITDNTGSFKNIFKDGFETKTSRKTDFTRYKDDWEDEFLIYNKKDIVKNDSQNISLPCEFCEEMIPAENLYSHEETCKFKKNINDKFNLSLEKEETVECAYCGQSWKISKIDVHESICLQAIKCRDSARQSWRAEKSNVLLNRKSLNTKPNSPLPNGFDRSPDQRFSLDHFDSPKNNNDRQKNLRRSQSSGESSGAVPRTQARNLASRVNNKSFPKK